MVTVLKEPEGMRNVGWYTHTCADGSAPAVCRGLALAAALPAHFSLMSPSVSTGKAPLVTEAGVTALLEGVDISPVT